MTRYQNEFFPSLSWARQFGPVQTSLAYSFKTIRPNYNDLSSYGLRGLQFLREQVSQQPPSEHLAALHLQRLEEQI